MTEEQFRPCSKKGRGRSQKTLDLIDAMHDIAEAAQPITGRGVGYKLFTMGLIPSMASKEMKRVYNNLRIAREEGTVPWEWIVDETRTVERAPSWRDPAAFVATVRRSYRRDFWNQQPCRVEVWSEKGTVRGVLKPVLNECGVGFRVLHGYASATAVHDAAEVVDERDLFVLYVGDYDPSGMNMSEHDLPIRLDRYGGFHVSLRRIALLKNQTHGLTSFPASDKAGDNRYAWFVRKFGSRCWELDAMDPNDLRDCVESEIEALIEPEAWARCEVVNKAEQESLRHVLDVWGAP